MYRHGGSTSFKRDSRLAECWRDLHVVGQTVTTAPEWYPIGGNLGNGRCRTAMYTDSIEQLRGTAGARQVTVRAETALGAFTTPSSGGWIMFGKHPS